MRQLQATVTRALLARTSVSVLLVLLALPLCAQERYQDPQPTTLTTVIASSLRHFPLILAAQAGIAQRQGQVLAAQGAFDPVLEGGLDSRLSGYYSGTSLDAGYYQTLSGTNTRVFAGYRVSEGSFPSYDLGSQTRESGEFRMGFALSLLRDRDIDSRRAGLDRSQLEVLAQRHQLTTEQLRVMQQAYIAYAQWLLAARLLEAYQELLAVAEARGEALQTSVEAGDVAEILLVENRQAVVQRQGLVVDAQRQIDMAAELLALYLRDDSGQVLYPRYAPQLDMPPEDPADFSEPVERLLPRVLERRPEIAIARLAQEQAGIRFDLAENLAKPQLDLRVYTSRDFGAGPASLSGTDNIADLSFSIPLRTRSAQGQAAAARAEIDSLEYQIRLLHDQVGMDIRRALVNLDATRQMEQFALEELEMSQTLATAEQQRFAAGLSDFFLLNVRERQVGEAQLKRWQAHLAHQIALAQFHAATMNVAGLGHAGPWLLP